MPTEAYIYDAIRTPRGRGKANGSLHDVRPLDLLKTCLLYTSMTSSTPGVIRRARMGVSSSASQSVQCCQTSTIATTGYSAVPATCGGSQ